MTGRATSRSTRSIHPRAGKSPRTPGEYVSTAWIPGNLLNEGLTTIDFGLCSVANSKFHHHMGVNDALLLSRFRSGERGLIARRLPGADERGRPAATRMGRRGAIVGIVLVRNEDVFVEQAIRNVAAFCDRIHVADHVSTDRTLGDP